METLSATVSSLNLPALPPRPKPPRRSISHRFKATVNATASANLPASSSPSHNKSSPNFIRAISLPLPHPKPSKAPAHEKAASGFAAALVSVCQSKNCLGRTREDARRLMELLVGEEKKRNKVSAERAKFGKHLKGLLSILAARGKSEILVDVLKEFERICNELVLVVEPSKLVSAS